MLGALLMEKWLPTCCRHLSPDACNDVSLLGRLRTCGCRVLLQGAEAYQVMREELAEEDILVEWGGTCTRPVRVDSIQYPDSRQASMSGFAIAVLECRSSHCVMLYLVPLSCSPPPNGRRCMRRSGRQSLPSSRTA